MNIFQHNSFFRHLSFLTVLSGGLLLTAHVTVLANAAETPAMSVTVPYSLAGMDASLQIEETVSSLTSGFPTQGVIVKHYQFNDGWHSEGAGGSGHRNASGSYAYHRTGVNSAMERSVDLSQNGTASSISYTFNTTKSGTWVQSLQNGKVTLRGSFTLSKGHAPAEQQFAPASNAGLHVALIIKSALSTALPAGSFPARGLVLQSYATDGTLTFQGFGPGNINSRGTYSYKKVSANTAVEETLQTSDFFSLSYTMVYTFTSPNTGVWYQNFNNGMIRFSGTFDTFPR